MRPLEIFLTAAVGLAVAVVAIRWLRRRAWARLVWAVAGVAALVQIASEGARWQLWPAYALAAGFLVAWLLSLSTMRRAGSPGRVVTGIGVVLLVIALAVSVALPVALPVFGFPAPPGPYGIGTATYQWTENRPELFTAARGDRRRLMARVWYPAARHVPGPRAPYIPHADVVTPTLARLAGFPSYMLAQLRYVTTNAVPSAPPAPGRFPVLIYLTGLNGFPASSTFQVEPLVARGYVVVGLDQPGVSAVTRFPDGRVVTGLPRDRIQPLIDQSTEPRRPAPTLNGTPLPNGVIPYFGADVPIAVDRLTALNRTDRLLAGRLDLSRLGVFGVSLGSLDTGEACRLDPRVRACLAMDSAQAADVVRAGLKQPTMFITRDAATMRLERSRTGGWSEHSIALALNTMSSVYRRLPRAGYLVQVPGMFHPDFTDLPMWTPAAPVLGLTGPYGTAHGHATVNAYTQAFFDTHLRGHPSPLLTGPSPRFPGVRIQVRH